MWFIAKQESIEKSGVFNNFVDYHSHLLPGVDDGMQTLEETLDTLNYFEEHGAKTIWFTPHIMEDIPNTTEHLQQQFRALQKVYQGNIELHLAAEYMLDGLFDERLAARDLLLHGQNEVLVETSYFNPPMGLENTLKEILSKGYFPVLAHPERYNYMTMDQYIHLHNIGVKFQLNLPAIVGSYGSTVKKKAEELLFKGIYDFIGTDTHTLSSLKKNAQIKISKKHITALNKITHAEI